MNSKQLVSVIVIFLNAEKFILEAIESVFAQTYDHWELLLVDDGSTDHSTEITLQYAKQHPNKVRYLEHEGHQNQGMSATRNLGIHNARGEYIAFLDSDDVWLPLKLEQQVAIMESQPEAAMVCGRSQYWYSWTGKPEDMQLDYIPDGYLQGDTLYHPPMLLTLCYPLEGATSPPPSDILLQRKAVELIGGFEAGFQGIHQMYEDQAFFAKLYLNNSVFVSNKCWDKYRLHPDSCSSGVIKIGQYHTVRLFFLNWLEKYLTDQESKDSRVSNALQRALWPYRHPTLHKLTQNVKRLKGQVKRVINQTLPVEL